ncbi:hypothetical protein [Stenotrophomonas maltophilia]|uniref:hypothetical protein n=1 Tax=Stenotrophomonas maltophilia TaxID=40324 RepID=UPI0039F70A69
MAYLATMKSTGLTCLVDEALRSRSLPDLHRWGQQRGLTCSGSVHHEDAGTIRGRVGEGYFELLWEKPALHAGCRCIWMSCALWAANRILVLERGRIAATGCRAAACVRP